MTRIATVGVNPYPWKETRKLTRIKELENRVWYLEQILQLRESALEDAWKELEEYRQYCGG